MKAFIVLLAMCSSAAAQVLDGGCTSRDGSTAWTSNIENCTRQGGMFYPNVGYSGPITGTVAHTGTVTTLGTYATTTKCPEGYTVVYASRPMCARDLVEPE